MSRLTANTEIQNLLVIDQAPLIEDALDACQRACRIIEQLKTELYQFENEDLPAYDRWYHATFGKHLTDVRELASFIREKEQYLASAKKRHWERFFAEADVIEEGSGAYAGGSRGSGGRARAHHGLYDEENSFDSADDGSWYEEELRYEEEGANYDDDFYDEDPDSVRRFEDLFIKGSAWKSGSYRSRSWNESESDRHRSEQKRQGGFDSSSESAGPRQEQRKPEERSGIQNKKGTLETRLKERYRILVKRLHPDINADLTAEQKSLWNQVQAAYQQKNLEQLDVLVALSEAFTEKVSNDTSVDQLRKAAREIERLIAPLKKRIEEAKKNRAWKFMRTANRAPLRKIVEEELRRELAKLRETLRQLDIQIFRFTRNAVNLGEPTDPRSGRSMKTFRCS